MLQATAASATPPAAASDPPPHDLKALILSHLRNDSRFFTSRSGFTSARPFPHIALDNIVPEWLLDKVDEEFPEHILPHDCRKLGRRMGWHCTMQANRVGGYLKLGVNVECAGGSHAHGSAFER